MMKNIKKGEWVFKRPNWIIDIWKSTKHNSEEYMYHDTKWKVKGEYT